MDRVEYTTIERNILELSRVPQFHTRNPEIHINQYTASGV